MSARVLEALTEHFGDDVVLGTHSNCGDDTALIAPEKIAEVCDFLKHDPALSFEMFIDCTCVDWLEDAPRFEVVYHLYSMTKKHRVRLKCRVPEDDPRLPTVSTVWKGANWFEREAFDMYGIVFDGHPDPRRILLYPEFVGHPLRKDYPLAGEQPLVEMLDPESQRPLMPRMATNDLVSIGPRKDD